MPRGVLQELAQGRPCFPPSRGLRLVRSRCWMATPRAFPRLKRAAQRRLLDDSYAPGLSFVWLNLAIAHVDVEGFCFRFDCFACQGSSEASLGCPLALDSLASVRGRRLHAARLWSGAQEATVAGDTEAGVSAAAGAAGLHVAAPASSAIAQDLVNIFLFETASSVRELFLRFRLMVHRSRLPLLRFASCTARAIAWLFHRMRTIALFLRAP